VEDDVITSIVECSDGGFALVGMIYSWKDETYDNDIMLIRTDKYGIILWNQTFGGPEADRDPKILPCSDGGFAIASNTNNFGAEKFDMWLIRTDANGNHLWNSTYGGSEFDGVTDFFLSDSGYLLIGSSESFLPSGAAFNPDIYLVCTDTNGNLLWNRTYGDWKNDDGYRILPLTTGGYLLVGKSGQHTLFRNIWFICINQDADVIWEKIVGPSGADCWDIIPCSSGGYVLVGTYRFTTEFGSDDFYLGRVDNLGNLIWERRYGISGTSEAGLSMIELVDRSFLISGVSSVVPGAVWLLRVIDASPILLALLPAILAIVGIISAVLVIVLMLYLFFRRRQRVLT
jgi:hypothetical protein